MCAGKPKDIVERAKKAGVGIIVSSGINPERIKKTLEFASEFKEIRASLGIYPVEMLELSESEIAKQIEIIRKNKDKVVAIGEIGMDLKEAQQIEKQKDNFRRLIGLAIDLDKPILVHSRKAEKECIDIIEEMKVKKVIMHCFNGNFKLVERVRNNGWCMTIPTNATFSEHFQKIIKETPIEQLFCETDSPFLHPNKERNNEPANVVESYKKIAEIKGITLREAEKKIEENYRKMFEQGYKNIKS